MSIEIEHLSNPDAHRSLVHSLAPSQGPRIQPLVLPLRRKRVETDDGVADVQFEIAAVQVTYAVERERFPFELGFFFWRQEVMTVTNPTLLDLRRRFLE